MSDKTPCYICSECYEARSWFAQDLRVDAHGDLWCEGCWDGTHGWDDNNMPWSELGEFVPDDQRRIAALEAQLEAVRGLEVLTNAEAESFAALYGFDPGFIRADELRAALRGSDE